MSITNRHSIVPFVSGTTKALADQRLAKVGYKTTKKTPAKFPSVAASVPFLQITDEQCILARSLILAKIAELQDGIIRSIYESSDGTRTEVGDDEISFEACLAFAEAEENGSRLTIETIATWFDSSLVEMVEVLVAEKLKFDGELNDAQRKTIAPHVQSVKEILASLAGGKTVLSTGKINGCRIYLALADSEDEMAARLTRRLDAMEKKIAEQAAKDAQFADLLGFAD